MRQKRWQAVVAGLVEESVSASLAHARHIGDGDGQEVEHVGHRGAVEVSVRLDAAVQGDHRIVDGACQLCLGHALGVRGGVAGGTVHDGRAAQRVGVLHAGAFGALMAGHDRRSSQQFADVARGQRLARLRAQRLQISGEHLVGAKQPFHAERGGEVCGLQQLGQIVQGKREHAEHAIGSVDEGQAFLFAEVERLDAGGGQRLRCGHELAGGIAHLSLADAGQRHVAQRREVSRAAKRAVFAYHRGDAGV